MQLYVGTSATNVSVLEPPPHLQKKEMDCAVLVSYSSKIKEAEMVRSVELLNLDLWS